jgi:L-Ala-D/L-Glu epimerase
MFRELTVRSESWALASPFRISRGTKTSAEVIVVEIRQDGVCGRGEAVPYARYGETVESVAAAVRRAAPEVAAGISREDLSRRMGPGAARNAVDCALWDLSARLSGESVAAQLGFCWAPALATALTVSLDAPQSMATAATRLCGARFIKVKVDAEEPEEQVRAVREAAPLARLIVDPNESWTLDILGAMQPVLVETRVELIEQPLPAANDAALERFRGSIPLCADESCHVKEDLPQLRARYQAVNIKLDKSGGLTGALELLQAARTGGFQVMVGCMVCTSLGIAPAFHVARNADFVDLDGPLWLAQDRPEGVRYEEGWLRPPGPGLWGGG